MSYMPLMTQLLLVISIVMIRLLLRRSGREELSTRDKLMCIHFFVFSATIVCNLVWSCIDTEWSLKDEESTIKETRVHHCKMFVVSNIFLEILYALDIVMLCLLIYMTEKASTTPLQEFWKKVLTEIERSRNLPLLSLMSTEGAADDAEAIKRYNTTSIRNADFMILNILNNLTHSNENARSSMNTISMARGN